MSGTLNEPASMNITRQNVPITITHTQPAPMIIADTQPTQMTNTNTQPAQMTIADTLPAPMATTHHHPTVDDRGSPIMMDQDILDDNNMLAHPMNISGITAFVAQRRWGDRSMGWEDNDDESDTEVVEQEQEWDTAGGFVESEEEIDELITEEMDMNPGEEGLSPWGLLGDGFDREAAAIGKIMTTQSST